MGRYEKIGLCIISARSYFFPGLCSKRQTKELYLQSNIGIVSSNSETFGQSIVEPFVLGRCILTTAVGVAPDIIATGKMGSFLEIKMN